MTREIAVSVNWRRHAACRGEDPDLFFPKRGEPIEPAMSICARCPVRKACLEAHLHEQFGIFGGTTQQRRRQIRGERKEDAS